MAERHAVILAGSLRPSPLRHALDVPELCLPVTPDRVLLEAWRLALETVGPLTRVVVVVRDETDVRSVTAVVRGAVGLPWCEIVTEPAAWRGTSGVVRDLTGDLVDDPADDKVVIVAEAAVLPPGDLSPLVHTLRPGDAGVVGVGSDDEPAGVFALTGAAVGLAPEKGYHDIKEQLLPALHEASMPVRSVPVTERVCRIRDRSSYLAAVAQLRHAVPDANEPDPRTITPQTSVARSAVVDGDSLVEPGVIVEEDAVIHDSVVLSGATIGAGAVVTRSVVAPMSVIRPGARVVREMILRGPEARKKARPIGPTPRGEAA
jgi:carbonic anhydrase/acetyltransferase-like protein (isoleucine patch superfamily)